jgi:hypothetical protein
MRYLQIDLNRRTAAGYSPAAYTGDTPGIGEAVVVFEPEDAVEADGVVVSVDTDRCIAIVAVDWDSMRDHHVATPAFTGSSFSIFTITDDAADNQVTSSASDTGFYPVAV